MPVRDSASARARRLLGLLPHLRGQGAHSLAQLAALTGSDTTTLASDLTTLSLCGADERDPNSLVAVLVEGDEALVFGDMPALGAPIRLTRPEVRALLAALNACGVGPDSPLGRRIASIAAEPGDHDLLSHALRTSVMPADIAERLSLLAALASTNETARIAYSSAGSRRPSDRLIRPLQLLYSRDAWYLLAFDETASAERTFRLDRISEVHRGGAHFEPPKRKRTFTDPAPDPAALPRTTIVFAHDDPDLNERGWPGATFERREDGTVSASVPYAGTGWIARKVVARMGDAVVEQPEEVRAAVAAWRSA